MKAILLHSAELSIPAAPLRAPWQVVHTQCLSDRTLERLAGQETSLLVSLTRSLPEAQEAGWWAASLRLCHLPICLENAGARALLGPLEQPGRPGCLECLRLRQDEAGTSTSHAQPSSRSLRMAAPGWPEALSALAFRLSVSVPAIVYELDLRSLGVHLRTLLPSGRCPRCGARHPGTRPYDPLLPAPRPCPPEDLERFEGDASFVRQRRVEQLQGLERLVDERFGPVLNLRRGSAATQGLPGVSAQAAVADVRGRVYGIGRAPSFRAAQPIALLEALERVSGLRDGTGRPRVRASLEALGEQALDPRLAGLYTREQYDRPGFRCRPFDPEEPIDWVWGRSLNRRRTLLVPADLVFYGTQEGRPLVAETSSGCSMGSSPEEALLFGLLELLERDAALRLWYRQQPVPRLQCEGGTRLAALLRDRLGQLGYEVQCFDATTEIAMPVAVLVAQRTTGAGAAALCASGAHPRMAVAVERALSELTTMAAWGSALSDEEWARARALEHDPGLARDIGDHLLAMACVSARARLRFLLEGTTKGRPLSGYEGPDGTLSDMVRRLGQAGLELVAVEQTPADLRRLGLCCARAIVPGLIPLHIGATLRRQVLAGGGERWPEAPLHPFS